MISELVLVFVLELLSSIEHAVSTEVRLYSDSHTDCTDSTASVLQTVLAFSTERGFTLQNCFY